ncbi:MAG TPA: response regulator [Anaerolineales bacterium]|nr:response regulator [Anaerolineales bacterium]
MVTWKTDIDTIPLHTVLIISDQQENVAIWDALFSQRNCVVLSESNVSDALQSARLLSPSLMLVDLSIPKSERISLIAGLRAASRGPVLMLISASTIEEIVDANQEGADECLVKPVNPAVLVVKAIAWLGHGQRSERAPAVVGVTL